MRETDRGEAPLPFGDLRSRMTQRAQQFLEAGENLLIVGGPLTGKTTMLKLLADRIPNLSITDNAAFQDLRDGRYEADGPMAVTVAASTTSPFQIPENFRLLPLVNVNTADVRRAFADSSIDYYSVFAQGYGHPYLTAEFGNSGADDVLVVRVREVLDSVPDLLKAFSVLVEEASGCTPNDLYRYARHSFGPDAKSVLDRLTVLGVVTRYIFDDRAALSIPACLIEGFRGVPDDA